MIKIVQLSLTFLPLLASSENISKSWQIDHEVVLFSNCFYFLLLRTLHQLQHIDSCQILHSISMLRINISKYGKLTLSMENYSSYKCLKYNCKGWNIVYCALLVEWVDQILIYLLWAEIWEGESGKNYTCIGKYNRC